MKELIFKQNERYLLTGNDSTLATIEAELLEKGISTDKVKLYVNSNYRFFPKDKDGNILTEGPGVSKNGVKIIYAGDFEVNDDDSLALDEVKITIED